MRLPQTTGMPRSHAARHDTGRHVATRTSHVLFSLFSSQSFAFALDPQPHYSQLLEGKLKRASNQAWKLIIKNNIIY
jgi:hypothetical protein